MTEIYKTFVSIGNAKQPFLRLLKLVQENLDFLPRPVLIQCGHTNFQDESCQISDFINMDSYLHILKHAEVIILHGGAGCILQTLNFGKTPFVMPREKKFNEHINNHQVGFVNALHNEGMIQKIQTSHELIRAVTFHSLKSLSKQKSWNAVAFTTIQKKLETILSD